MRIVTAVGALSTILAANTAFAFAVGIPGPAGQTTVIGVENRSGKGFIATERFPGGPCDVFQLTANNSNALSQNYTVYGTSGNDVIYGAPPWGMQLCGSNWTPLNMNGFTIVVDAGRGDDIVSIVTPGFQAIGNAGNDQLLNYYATSALPTLGGDGNDKVWAVVNNVVTGDAGDDLFCVGNQGALRVDGGSGYDTMCNTPTYWSGIDAFICDSRCGY